MTATELRESLQKIQPTPKELENRARRSARPRTGISQEELADRLQVSRRTMSYWLAGKIVPPYSAVLCVQMWVTND